MPLSRPRVIHRGVPTMKDLATDFPTLDLSAMPTLAGCSPDVLQIESELSDLPHLDGDRRQEEADVTTRCRDARKEETAAAALGRIPGPREAFHLIVSGRFALWDFTPAVLSLAAPATIDTLHVATLGFSKPNVAALAQLLDTGAIGQARLLCSHYFKGTSQPIYDYAVEEIAKRANRAEMLSIRTHAKLLAMALSDGRTVTLESSANLRSCQNIEQVTAIGSPAVYRFHTRWIDDLFTRAAAKRLSRAEAGSGQTVPLE